MTVTTRDCWFASIASKFWPGPVMVTVSLICNSPSVNSIAPGPPVNKSAEKVIVSAPMLPLALLIASRRLTLSLR